MNILFIKSQYIKNHPSIHTQSTGHKELLLNAFNNLYLVWYFGGRFLDQTLLQSTDIFST